jgi:hypothetical protein
MSAHAAEQPSDFTGHYRVEICPNGIDKPCGEATFTLIQVETRICGDHTFVAPGAGRMNEGFPGSVRGTIVGRTAVLTVTSGRNKAIVIGKALLNGQKLEWETLEEIAEGEPSGESLIFAKGTLTRDDAAEIPSALRSKC